MTDFIKWLFHYDRPAWIVVAAILLMVALFLLAVIVSIVCIVFGYWIVPVLIWIVLPAVIVAVAYAEDKKGADND